MTTAPDGEPTTGTKEAVLRARLDAAEAAIVALQAAVADLTGRVETLEGA